MMYIPCGIQQVMPVASFAVRVAMVVVIVAVVAVVVVVAKALVWTKAVGVFTDAAAMKALTGVVVVANALVDVMVAVIVDILMGIIVVTAVAIALESVVPLSCSAVVLTDVLTDTSLGVLTVMTPLAFIVSPLFREGFSCRAALDFLPTTILDCTRFLHGDLEQSPFAGEYLRQSSTALV